LLNGTKVTADGVAALHKALPDCKIDWDGGTIEPSTSPELERKAAEWVLSMGGGTIGINEEGTEKFQLFSSAKDLPARPLLIMRVQLNDNRVTSADLERLKPLTNLTYLEVHSLRCSKRCPNSGSSRPARTSPMTA
jgi:hypothetical protein